MISARGLEDGKNDPPVFETRDLPDYAATASEITIDTLEGPRRYNVIRRNLIVTETGHRLDLSLALVPKPMTLRLFKALDKLPEDRAKFLLTLVTLAIGGLVLFGGYTLFDHRFTITGFLLQHAQILLAVTATAWVFYLALVYPHAYGQYFLGGLSLIVGTAIFFLVGGVFPQLSGLHNFDIDYATFGEATWNRRDAILALLAPWVPTLGILLRAIGRDIAASLIEKNIKI